MVKDTAIVNPLRLYMRTRPRNGFTSSHTMHPIHATGSRAKLSTKKLIKSIAVDQSRVESREGSKVKSIDWVDRQLYWIDRVARLDRFRGLSHTSWSNNQFASHLQWKILWACCSWLTADFYPLLQLVIGQLTVGKAWEWERRSLYTMQSTSSCHCVLSVALLKKQMNVWMNEFSSNIQEGQSQSCLTFWATRYKLSEYIIYCIILLLLLLLLLWFVLGKNDHMCNWWVFHVLYICLYYLVFSEYFIFVLKLIVSFLFICSINVPCTLHYITVFAFFFFVCEFFYYWWCAF